MRYKVQSFLVIHFPLWSVLNIERIGPQISIVGSYGMMTVVWVVCSSAWHRDTWGQARAQDLSWRIVLGKGSQSGWSGSKGEKCCLLSISASLGRKASRTKPGWEMAQIQWEWPGSQQATGNKPGSQCVHVKFTHVGFTWNIFHFMND